jgi:uncharacterized protein YggE
VRFLTIVLGCLLGAMMVFGGFMMGGRAAGNAAPKEPDEPHPFVISGDGIVKARPDIFRATFHVEGQGETTTKAHENLQARMTRVLTRMTQLGVQEKDLATGLYHLRGRYQAEQQQASDGKKKPVIVRNTLNVTIRDVDHAGQYLDAALEAGATSIDMHGFAIEDLRAVRNQARKMAAENARERAELIATGTGAKLGRVLSISDRPPDGYYPQRYAQNADQFEAPPADAAAPAGVVLGLEDAMEPGMEEVSMTLYVVYELL